MSYQVSLHLYDLSNGMARTMSRNFLGKQIDGIWHTGILVYGKEFYYGGGICQDPPGKTPYGNPMKTIPIGSTEIPEELFLDFLKEIQYKFTADKYDLFENNCNNFSDACSEFLTGQKIPSYITGLPKEVLATPMGQMLKPMISQMQQNMQQNSHPMFNQGGMGGGFGAPSNTGGMNQPSYNNVPQYAQQGAQQGPAVLNITAPDEFTRVIKNNPAVIVDFFSYTCPPCMKIKPFFESLAKSFQARCPGLKFVSVNTQEARMISMQYQITSIPTFIAFLNGNEFQKFSGADSKRLEGLAYTLEGKINAKDGKGITANGTPVNTNTPSFQLFNPNKKDFFTFSGVNYPLPIKNITEKLAGYPALNENEAKEIFTKFAEDPSDKVKSFSAEEKTYLVNWIFETMFYIEISDKTLGFLDLLRMLSLDQSFLEIIYKSEDKLYQIIRFFEKPEQTLKELPKGLKLVLLRLMTNLTATDKCKPFFQNNLSSFIELMIRAGNLYRDDKPSLYPILMTIWNLVQHLYNTKEFATSAGSVLHFTKLVFNESTDNEVLLGCTLILTWLSFHSKEIRKEADRQVDKAKLAKLEFSDDQNLGKMTRDLSDILKQIEI